MRTIGLLAPGEEARTALIEFVAALSASPEHHIGYCGLLPEEITASFDELRRPLHESMVVAQEDGELVGALGFDADTELGRTWLYGPFVHHGDWAALADALFAALHPLLDPAAPELEIFCDAENINCRAFAERHGFEAHGQSLILRFPAARAGLLGDAGVTEMPAMLYPAFQALHDRLFPRTYFPSATILDRLGETRKLLAAVDGETLLGYIYTELKAESHEGSIEYVAVSEHARGKGVATTLVSAALRWLFTFDVVRQIDLVTSTENAVAIAVYRKAGFEVANTMCAFRKATR